ncbi:MAG: Bacterial lipid biosynthesis acyltransferase [Solirubrobacteraceae bacterium]|jgi:lauroyl/myristoyl acyltransferase|nr:Bacterial lipid biosynthesis acyltransferase [Solirubrobacteraceae bacterium]
MSTDVGCALLRGGTFQRMRGERTFIRVPEPGPAVRLRSRVGGRWARAERFLAATTGAHPSRVTVLQHLLATLLLRVMERYPRTAARRRLRNERALADAVAEGRGVIVAHTHLFGPALDSVTLAARGYPGAAVSVSWPEHAGERLERITAALGAYGGSIVVRGEGSLFDQVAEGLRRGEIFHMSVDVPGSTEARFLGCQGRVAGGVGSLAELTGACVVPVAPSRSGLALEVHEPMRSTGDPRALTQRLCDWASSEILARPYAWEDNDLGLMSIGRTADEPTVSVS